MLPRSISLDKKTIDYLLTLSKVVKNVSSNGEKIYYTSEFREYAIARYESGDSPSAIFRDKGIGPEIIGYKRVERCIARWCQCEETLTTAERRQKRIARIEREIASLRRQEAELKRLQQDSEADR